MRIKKFLALVAALFAIDAGPAHAWTFSAAPICNLQHEDAELSVRLTYDPVDSKYEITLTKRALPWQQGPVFALRFEGGRPLTITTDRHYFVANDPLRLGVADRGFGNVLNGLEYNTTATALIGDQSSRFQLTGAAPEVRRFRACADALSV